MTKMSEKKELKRAAILQAAIETFQSDGYIGASMDSIASKAGVTKQTVYRYYDSKEALYAAVLTKKKDSTRGPFTEELNREDSREALLHFAKGFVKSHLTDDHLAIMRLLLSEGPKAPEMTRTHFAIGPQVVQERLAAFLNERFTLSDTEYAIKMLLNTLLSMTMNVILGRSEPPTEEEMNKHAERTVDLFMRLLSDKYTQSTRYEVKYD